MSESPNMGIWKRAAALMMLLEGNPADVVRSTVASIARAMLVAGHDEEFVATEMAALATCFAEMSIAANSTKGSSLAH